MKNKKGFTLIELLAVIVILAIIMVIAVPQILKVIEKSRENAAKSSIDLLKSGIQTQIASGELTTNPFTKDNDNSGCYTFDFDSDTNGNVSKLEVKNKEKFTGQVKYCNGTITDTNLAFDGNTGSSTPSEKRFYLYNKGTNTGLNDRTSSTSCGTTHTYTFNSDNITVDYDDQNSGCTGWAELYSNSDSIDMSKYKKAVVEFKSITITDDGKVALYTSNNIDGYSWLVSSDSGNNVKLELDLSEYNASDRLRLVFTTKPESGGMNNFSYGWIDQYRGNVDAEVSAIYLIEK